MTSGVVCYHVVVFQRKRKKKARQQQQQRGSPTGGNNRACQKMAWAMSQAASPATAATSETKAGSDVLVGGEREMAAEAAQRPPDSANTVDGFTKQKEGAGNAAAASEVAVVAGPLVVKCFSSL